MRVLDLFAGIGGTARGIQRCLTKKDEYVAIENDEEVCEVYRKNVPGKNIPGCS